MDSSSRSGSESASRPRAEIGQVLRNSFPLPDSNEFADLLAQLDGKKDTPAQKRWTRLKPGLFR